MKYLLLSLLLAVTACSSTGNSQKRQQANRIQLEQIKQEQMSEGERLQQQAYWSQRASDDWDRRNESSDNSSNDQTNKKQ